ncbi:MAG: glycosyltransferase family 39 protein [Candidatus Woesebacteria bacterium]|nr:glycosyltransferase family 39 protein [Candidatus Woesebacteria bacterium]
MLKKLIKEILDHKVVYFLLLIILGFGLFLRVYNLNAILGFYYDQGRDALSIWNLWHLGNIPFIGPTTGIAGIFRGPLYYYLIAPFYLIGKGNPIYPSVFLSLTTVIASGLMYYLGFKIQDRVTGLIAAIISCFSFNIIMASRWLSNPTPMLLLSMLFVWMLILIVEGKKWAWAPAIFIATVSLFHFGSAGEVFYFVALLVVFVWQLKLRRLPNKKIIIWSTVLVLLTLLPLIAFDIKNHGLIVENIKKFLFTEGSFKLPAWWMVGDKFDFYYDVFTNKLFNARYYYERFLLGGVLLIFFYNLHRLIKKDGVKVLVLLLSSVILGVVFFQGNFGNFYDYYLTGYYLPFLLLFAITLGSIRKSYLGKIFVIYFIYIFLSNNSAILKFKLMDKGDGPNSISFWAQKQAIAWIYNDTKGKDFNVDVYVPPVIPYAYDYLFKWLPTTPRLRGTKGNLVENNIPLLYLLYEHDPDHQERIDAWMARQKGIAKSEEIKKFGAITVERRIRIK